MYNVYMYVFIIKYLLQDEWVRSNEEKYVLIKIENTVAFNVNILTHNNSTNNNRQQ